jgi:hypothetical protein
MLLWWGDVIESLEEEGSSMDAAVDSLHIRQ